jgi:hypothetical protein
MKEVLPSDASIIAVEISQQQNARTTAKTAEVTATNGLCTESVRGANLSDASGPTNIEGSRQNDARYRCPLKHPSSLLAA